MSLKFFNTWLYREITENQSKLSKKINFIFLGLGIVREHRPGDLQAG